METRLDYPRAAPTAYQAMLGLEKALAASTLPKALMHLVKLRASQLNGCAYCIDMHARDARAAGESEHKLYALDAWRESPLFDDRERAALAWTEALTRIAETHAPDEVYRLAQAQFPERELAELSWLIAAINAWNRIAIGFRAQPPAR
jgi:AhpD family alkylhydroperoxidase